MNLANLENLRIMYSNELLMDDSQKAISNGYSSLTLKLANAVIAGESFNYRGD